MKKKKSEEKQEVLESTLNQEELIEDGNNKSLVEEKGNKNKAKKKKIWVIVLTCILILLLIGGTLLYINRDKVFANVNLFNKKKSTAILNDSEVRILEKLTLHSGESLDIKDFFEEDVELGNVEITFVNQDENVDSKDLAIAETNVIIGVGTYDVIIKIGEKNYNSILEVLDKTEPILEVQDIEIVEGSEITKESFVVSCEDNSKVACAIYLLDEDGKEITLDTNVGTRKYWIVARDEALNETKKEVNLTVTKQDTDNKSENKTNSSNSNNSSSSNGKTIVSKKTETEESYEEAKYGTRYKITKTIQVTTYSDGTESRETTKTSKKLDASGFNAKTADLKPEATLYKSKESTNINQILTATNQYRTEVGLKPLVLDDKLTVAATIRAMEMAWGDEKSHTRPDGTSCFTIIEEFYPTLMTREGENIAYGQTNGTSAAKWWRNSPGHYRNMTDSGFTHIGIGVYKLDGTYYYVQLFALFTD